jgi:two-component system response regulator AtoC
VVSGNPSIGPEFQCLLRQWGYLAELATTASEALSAIGTNRVRFSVVDMELEGTNDPEFVRRLRHENGTSKPVIAIFQSSARNDTGVAALGVTDVLFRPFAPDDLEKAIRRALDAMGDWEKPPADDSFSRLAEEVRLWCSRRMRGVLDIIEQAAGVNVPVLIEGETGTGKEVVARAIHHFSSRNGQPFVRVNCAAVPRALLESELFGHERGALAGTHDLKIGQFEAANHGTIFLDEIGGLRSALQAKLLHVLQDGVLSRVGGQTPIKVDVRVLAASNRCLGDVVKSHQFREDLYYRLNVIQIVVPPLRERPEEIPLLTQYFVRRYARLFHREGFRLGSTALRRLAGYRYPGNVRELENIVKRMIVLNDQDLDRIPFLCGSGAAATDTPLQVSPTSLSLKEVARQAVRSAEREAISQALQLTGWNRTRAARLLKISYRALLYKIKDTGLSLPPPESPDSLGSAS